MVNLLQLAPGPIEQSCAFILVIGTMANSDGLARIGSPRASEIVVDMLVRWCSLEALAVEGVGR